MDIVLWFQPNFLHLDNFRVSPLVPWESSNSLAWRLRASIMSPHCPYSDLLLRSYCSSASLKSLYLNNFTQAPTLGGTSILIFIYSSGNQSFNNWVSLVLETKPMVYVIHTRLFQSMLDGWLCFFHISSSPGSFLSVSPSSSHHFCVQCSMISPKASQVNLDASSHQSHTTIENVKNFILTVRKQDFGKVSRGVSQIRQELIRQVSLLEKKKPQLSHHFLFILF